MPTRPKQPPELPPELPSARILPCHSATPSPPPLPERQPAPISTAKPPGAQHGRLPKSPGGGLAAARNGRVAGLEEGRLHRAPRKGGAKLAGALCLFVSFFCSEGLVSSEPSVPRGPGVSVRTAKELPSCWVPCAAAGSWRTRQKWLTLS